VRGSQVRIPNTFGVLRLGLSRGSYGWKFIDTNGKTLDSGTSTCHR
jgi:hypothetical protein